jgi:hypothetical protein
MAITFREAAAEVELGLVSGDQLPDIAMAGLLEGYDSPSLTALAGRFGEPYDAIEVEGLWSSVLQELDFPVSAPQQAARVLVRAYARLVADGELPPQLGASKIAGVHRLACHQQSCHGRDVGGCIGAATIMRLFYSHDGHGYFNQAGHVPIDSALLDECRRLAALPLV